MNNKFMQEPDIILLEGTKQQTITFPYDSYLESMYSKVKFDSITDTCQRGYIATWEIRGDILYLNGLDAVFESKPTTDFREATWYSGFIRIPIAILSQEIETEILILVGEGYVADYYLAKFEHRGGIESNPKDISCMTPLDKESLRKILNENKVL